MVSVSSDPTQELRQRLQDPASWASVRRNVPVFKAHQAVKKDHQGRKQDISVRESDLPGIIHNTADVVPIYDGHLNLALPEHDPRQPPQLGYAANFRTGTWGLNAQTAILADIFLDTRPPGGRRVSVDYYLDGSIGSMALLKRKPELDLGIVEYHGNRRVVQYAMEDTMPDDAKVAPPKPDEGAAEPAPMEGEMAPEEKAKADMYMSYWMKSHPVMQYLAKCFQAGTAAAMGPGNAAPPAASPEGSSLPMPDTERGPAQMRSDQQAIQYAALESRLKRQDEEIARLTTERKREKAERTIVQYEALGYELDRADEVAVLVDLDESAWGKHLDRIKKFYRQTDPVMRRIPYSADGMVPVAGNEAVRTQAPTWHDAPPHHEAAMQYLEDHPGISYEKAVAHVCGTNGNGKA